MRDFYLILNSIVALALIILSIVAFLSDKKARANRLFLLFSSSVAVWLIAASVSNDIRISPDIAIIAKYLVFLCSYFASYFILIFVAVIIGDKGIARKVRYMSLPLIVIGLLSASPLVVQGISEQNNVYAVTFGPAVAAYAVALVGQLVAALIILYRGGVRARGKKRMQVKSLYKALIIAVPILLATQFIIPAATGFFDITDIGILIMVLPVIALYVGVVRHGLFDLRLAVVRTVAYGLSLAVLVGIYLLIAYTIFYRWFGDAMTGQHIAINMLLTLILAFIFQPIKKFFDRLTNRLFYKDIYNSEAFYTEMNLLVRSTVSLRTLLNKASALIKDTFKAESVSFFVYTSESSLLAAGTDGYKKIPLADTHAFDGLKSPVHIDDPSLAPELRRILVAYRVVVVVPLYKNESVIGMVCLGDHRISRYSRRDLRVLRVAAGELVIGIQNTLAVQEIRDLNENLQQRIDAATKELRRNNAQLLRLDATKDEFISMASHQLRTPLTSIKGYISMLIDGDLGKVTSRQRQVLEEAFTSSERMVHLIGDFLNISRLQTGKFVIERRPTALADLVEAEVRSLRQNAESRTLELVYAKPKNIPELNIDADKFRQVVMNFIDNAIFYSKPESSIAITLKKAKGCVEFKVKDTGIGVPESEQSGLFGKFFRATNARRTRPDGTGVGLFLAKKVVADHDGEIIFESKEGKGSTFGFRLPIPPAES